MATAQVPVPRILVVDDEPNIADLLSVALRFEGYDVMATGTGTCMVAMGQADLTGSAGVN